MCACTVDLVSNACLLPIVALTQGPVCAVVSAGCTCTACQVQHDLRTNATWVKARGTTLLLAGHRAQLGQAVSSATWRPAFDRDVTLAVPEQVLSNRQSQQLVSGLTLLARFPADHVFSRTMTRMAQQVGTGRPPGELGYCKDRPTATLLYSCHAPGRVMLQPDLHMDSTVEGDALPGGTSKVPSTAAAAAVTDSVADPDPVHTVPRSSHGHLDPSTVQP